jgi:hypothetical protein
MKTLQVQFHREERAYLGPELRPHFLLSNFGVRGSGLVVFVGPCQVQTENLVDWEDRLVNDSIRAERMIHFIGEFFGCTLLEGIGLQRILVSLFQDQLRARFPQLEIRREGDDLYLVKQSASIDSSQERWKLSVSIVAPSVSSVLLHLGVNLNAEGAPVQALGLLSPPFFLRETEIEGLVQDVLYAFQTEWDSMQWACVKVRGVV